MFSAQSCNLILITWTQGGGGYSRVQEMGMKKQRQKSKHPKNPMQNFQTLTNWVVLYWKKKMRLGYIDTTTNLQILLNTAKLSHPEKYFPNFLTQKSPRIENSTSHKSLDLLCHLKSRVTPTPSSPPPPACEWSVSTKNISKGNTNMSNVSLKTFGPLFHSI